MNIDIVKYPLSCFYTKCVVSEHNQIKGKMLRLIDSCQTTVKDPLISKLDWADSTNNDRDWYRFISPIIEKYMLASAIGSGYGKFSIHNMWFQQYLKNSAHPWHTHGSQLVGVYYLELAENSPKTELMVPFNQTEKIVLDIKEGDIVVFPSFVIHQAPEILDNTRKTILSWNMEYQLSTE